MTEDNSSGVFTLAEAARFVRVSEKTLRELASSGRVPAQKVGRAWRFLRAALEGWLAQREPASAGPAPSEAYSVRPVEPPPLVAEGGAGRTGFGDTAFTKNRSQPLHRWVPWIAGFSASFVGGVLEAASERDPAEVTVLDPFAGVGTTLVEAMDRGYDSIGFEINPYAALACRAKVSCLGYDLGVLRGAIGAFREHMAGRARRAPRSRPPAEFRSRAPFFSPAVERKVLHALDFIAERPEAWVADVFRVALGAVMVSFSNYSYEPSLGRRASAGKEDILDADVAGAVAAKLDEMATDVAQVQLHARTLGRRPEARVHCESFLAGYRRVPPDSVAFLITSPPYLNNYHYVRNTRPHLFWLGLVERRARLAEMEQLSFGKFWQTVRGAAPIALEACCDELAEQLDELRRLHPEKGIYGGSGWANYAAAYFNDCLAFCRAARHVMRPGGTAVVVIGNNILQGIEFRTDRYFAQIAEGCGFETVEFHPVRRKRTGSSIIRSSVRVGNARGPVELYETALELRAVPAKRRR
ncbi:MAG TPA: helix-turn-helix domain-containing protein [Planctomycetota bacterium]|nr:helix-turn-helix domain-containing protein [Planctomycetota bacterium]HRR79099.1 helix-turn-helix domain-containing protein [Planctomycetota bacterium]HRT93168.1 helix-turn-helix domain-containing protein [Planctomycetota bacterium]